MKKKIRLWIPVWMALVAAAALAGAQTPMRFVGTIAAVGSNSLTVKTDQGQSVEVEVPASAVLKRIAPGQRDLSTAASIQFSDLAVGDRALVRLDPNAPTGSSVALQIIAIKQADVQQRQQMEREAWQQRGVGGLVKSIDPSSGVIVLSSGAGPMARTIIVHTTPATQFKRYAPDSVQFDQATLAPITAIRVGDQMRARGEKNEDGTEIAADAVVSGSFRNISGRIVSIDAAASTLTVKDLATKKTVLIHITPEAQMRQLPERMATVLGALLQGKMPGGGQGSWHGGGQWRGQSDQGGQGGQAGQGGAWNHGGHSGGIERFLDRAPEIQLGNLKKGDAVMVVSTEGKSEVTAITLLAGVDPLLESPEASSSLLSSWSMNSGAGASDDTQ